VRYNAGGTLSTLVYDKVVAHDGPSVEFAGNLAVLLWGVHPAL
jgi:hypothetical protein